MQNSQKRKVQKNVKACGGFKRKSELKGLGIYEEKH